MKKLRGVIDGWCSYLDQREKENDYKDFISNPSAKEVHGHKGQSKFFWGHGVPSAKMSGMYNIRSLFEMQVRLVPARQSCHAPPLSRARRLRLFTAQVNHAIELGFMLFKVDEIFSEVTHEAFHDYRKVRPCHPCHQPPPLPHACIDLNFLGPATSAMFSTFFGCHVLCAHYEVERNHSSPEPWLRQSMRSMLVQNDMCGDSLLDTSNSAKGTTPPRHPSTHDLTRRRMQT